MLIGTGVTWVLAGDDVTAGCDWLGATTGVAEVLIGGATPGKMVGATGFPAAGFKSTVSPDGRTTLQTPTGFSKIAWAAGPVQVSWVVTLCPSQPTSWVITFRPGCTAVDCDVTTCLPAEAYGAKTREELSAVKISKSVLSRHWKLKKRRMIFHISDQHAR